MMRLSPYWKGRSNYEEWLAQIPDETRILRDHGVIYIDRKAVRGWGETTAGYEWLLREGINGITSKIKAHKAALDITNPATLKKITTCSRC
jgi:choline trimethylamine-lyase